MLPSEGAMPHLLLTGLIKSWKRKQNQLAYRWNVTDFEEEEGARPQFKGASAYGFYSDEGYFVEPPMGHHRASWTIKFTQIQESMRPAPSPTRQSLTVLAFMPRTSHPPAHPFVRGYVESRSPIC